jgi:hypothetical protein
MVSSMGSRAYDQLCVYPPVTEIVVHQLYPNWVQYLLEFPW